MYKVSQGSLINTENNSNQKPFLLWICVSGKNHDTRRVIVLKTKSCQLPDSSANSTTCPVLSSQLHNISYITYKAWMNNYQCSSVGFLPEDFLWKTHVWAPRAVGVLLGEWLSQTTSSPLPPNYNYLSPPSSLLLSLSPSPHHPTPPQQAVVVAA